MKKAWLRDWPWETIIAINSGLCKKKSPAICNGYEPAKKLWEDSRNVKMPLKKALQICRRCHQLSPFCFYNGNTFVAVGRTMIQDLLPKLHPMQAQVFRSVVGHYIAGTADEQELDDALAEIK